MNIIIITGFETITHNISFQPQTETKGNKLVLAEHVRIVEELRHNGQSYLIRAHVIRQTFVTLTPYKTSLNINGARVVTDVKSPHPWNITREMWLAEDYHHTATTDRYDPLKLVIIQHTVSGECHIFKDCSAAVRRLQKYFLTDENLGYDIPYNFLIGNDGRVYEGRGWNVEGAHTYTFNRCSLGIGFIGDYRQTQVTPSQVERLHLLLEDGIARGHIDPKYYIVPAKDLQNTESPGTNLYNAIKQWSTYDHELKFRGKSCDKIYGKI